MAVTAELMNNDDMRKALQEMCGRERSLVAELEKVREARKTHIAMMLKQADQMRNEAEQHGLALDFEAGDKSIICDGAAGNGAGSYRRSRITDETTCRGNADSPLAHRMTTMESAANMMPQIRC